MIVVSCYDELNGRGQMIQLCERDSGLFETEYLVRTTAYCATGAVSQECTQTYFAQPKVVARRPRENTVSSLSQRA
jgi:hypothetical protein